MFFAPSTGLNDGDRFASGMAQRPTVVIIDDEAWGREITLWMINRVSPTADVVACASGQEGVEAVKRTRADLVVTDNSMQDMSGIDVTKTLRASGYEGPIVMVTASHELRSAATAAGVTAFVHSIDLQELPKTISRLLNGEGAESQNV